MKKNSKSDEEKPVICDRVRQIRSILYDENNREFANQIGENEQVLSAICVGRRPAGITTIVKIAEKLPTINTNWLLTGEGDMLIKETSPNHRRTIVEPSSKDSTSDAQVSLLRDIIREKDEKIAELTTDIALLRQELRNLQYEKEGALAVPILTEMETSTI